MALITQFICSHCKTPRYELVNKDRMCADCRLSIESNQRRMFLENRQKYSIEQRLSMIEQALYDLNAEQRIGVLEAKNIQY